MDGDGERRDGAATARRWFGRATLSRVETARARRSTNQTRQLGVANLTHRPDEDAFSKDSILVSSLATVSSTSERCLESEVAESGPLFAQQDASQWPSPPVSPPGIKRRVDSLDPGQSVGLSSKHDPLGMPIPPVLAGRILRGTDLETKCGGAIVYVQSQACPPGDEGYPSFSLGWFRKLKQPPDLLSPPQSLQSYEHQLSVKLVITRVVPKEPKMTKNSREMLHSVWRLDASKLRLANRKAACFRPVSA
ncbi:hypothetical protein VTN96DRAFT_8327 [Rasamsonia emersonii]